MDIQFVVEGKTVYELREYTDGTKQKIKIRECNTSEEAAAVANYYKIRKE